MALEPNQVGVNEFTDFSKEEGTAPMIAVNLGTRVPRRPQTCGNTAVWPGRPIGDTYSWSDRICCSQRKGHCIPSVHTVISKRVRPTIGDMLRTTVHNPRKQRRGCLPVSKRYTTNLDKTIITVEQRTFSG